MEQRSNPADCTTGWPSRLFPGGLTSHASSMSTAFPATIYEADPSAEARTQGGQLDIHEYNGQLALEAAGLTGEFRAIIHEGGEATHVLDQHGTVLLEEPDDGTGGRPEVLRGDVRRILLDSLPEEMIQWGRKVTNAHIARLSRRHLPDQPGMLMQPWNPGMINRRSSLHEPATP